MSVEISPELRSRIDTLVANAAAKDHVRSIAWGIVAHGDLVAVGGIGELGEGQGVPDEHSLFRIASMTKSFTAAAVVHARDAGRLRLDDLVEKFVPEVAEWVMPTADSPLVTVRHLLTMSAGLATDDPWADRHMDISKSELRAFVAQGVSFAFTPGEAFQYSNLGYGLLGQVIEAASGLRAQTYITRHLLRPLGMLSTVWSLADVTAAMRVAHGFFTIDGEWTPEPPPLDDGCIAPMGGIWTTIYDLAKWVAFMADAWPANDEPDNAPLSRASRREQQRVHTDMPIMIMEAEVAQRTRLSVAGYGMGVNVTMDTRLGRVVNHSGGLPGYGSNMRWVPGKGIGIMAFGNERYAPMGYLTYDILDALADAGVVSGVAAPIVGIPARGPVALALTALISCLNSWDDAAISILMADNIFLDESLDRRRAAAHKIVADHGPLRIDSIEIESGSMGIATVVGATSGTKLLVDVMLTPHRVPLIQSYGIEVVSLDPPLHPLRDEA